MKVLVSACLLGENVKYNGGNNKNDSLIDFLKDKEVISVCPEMLGGLPCPRETAEIVDGVLKNADGTSVDFEFRDGAKKALEIAKAEGVDLAILQSRSPSCGVGLIYDGTFSGNKIKGNGVFAQELIDAGFEVLDVASKF